MEAPWISAYQPKEWTVQQIFVQSQDWLTLNESLRSLKDDELLVCAAESEMAAELWKKTKSVCGVLFFDIEQLLAMDLDVVYGGDVGVLTKEWKGHPVGSLVMTTYKGVRAEIPFMTIGVARERLGAKL